MATQQLFICIQQITQCPIPCHSQPVLQTREVAGGQERLEAAVQTHDRLDGPRVEVDVCLSAGEDPQYRGTEGLTIHMGYLLCRREGGREGEGEGESVLTYTQCISLSYYSLDMSSAVRLPYYTRLPAAKTNSD